MAFPNTTSEFAVWFGVLDWNFEECLGFALKKPSSAAAIPLT